MNPLITFLVVSHNSEKYIEDCLNSILCQTQKNFEIIVIDNNSKDKTNSILHEFKKYQQIEIISNTTNLGYGNALNIGISESKGEYLAILNADVILDKNWANYLLALFLNDDKIKAASGKILFPNGHVQSTGGIIDKYGAVLQREGNLFKTSKMSNDMGFFYCDGSSFMVKKMVLDQVWFDSKMFLYYEDVDLSWKIRMLNNKIDYSENAISYHNMGHSNSDMTLNKFYYISRNRICVCLKNYSLKKIIIRIPIVLLLIYLVSIYYDKSKKPKGYTRMFLRALWWNILNIGHIIKEHRRTMLIKKISDSELDSHMLNQSIEINFLKNKDKLFDFG